MNMTKGVRRATAMLALAGMIGVASPVLAQQAANDGVQVGKMSSLRNLVPEEQLEAAATQQYSSLKQQAQQQGALAPENHPQVKR
ncbi:hypothetical protein NK899_23830, partial [Salmonella enterica subsp. enterica serovar Typhimurium]|uniref:hypothetical protein n=1 Tax=Salmonella enterica TaxID=28901 RepID=UPI0020A585DC